MPAGRPSSYKPEYCEQAFKLCLLGADDKRIADFFEIAESTLYKWKVDYPDFSEALKNGKESADAAIAASLYNRAKGYVGKKTVVATNQGQVTDIKVVDEYVAPDTTAAIFWLKNRQSRYWRDKQDVEHSGNVTVTSMTDEQLVAELEKLKGD